MLCWHRPGSVSTISKQKKVKPSNPLDNVVGLSIHISTLMTVHSFDRKRTRVHNGREIAAFLHFVLFAPQFFYEICYQLWNA